MRIAVWLVIAIGCDAGAPTPKKASDTPKTPVPAGPYVVHYDCFHSDLPFGPGSQHRNLTYDLGIKKVTLLEWQTKGEVEELRPDTKPPEPPKPVVTDLSPRHVAALETAVVNVLRGGPYNPEYPVPEGTPCTLRIEASGKEVFKLEKAYTKEKDAPTALITAFAGQ